MTRIAHCCCGSLRAEATGEPAIVAACHCMECQRRTGSPYPDGPSKVYVRSSDSGRKPELHFCPDCGSTVFWYLGRFPATTAALTAGPPQHPGEFAAFLTIRTVQGVMLSPWAPT